MMGESNKTNCLLVVALAVIERDVEGGWHCHHDL